MFEKVPVIDRIRVIEIDRIIYERVGVLDGRGRDGVGSLSFFVIPADIEEEIERNHTVLISVVSIVSRTTRFTTTNWKRCALDTYLSHYFKSSSGVSLRRMEEDRSRIRGDFEMAN
jgi:hypothetical protein